MVNLLLNVAGLSHSILANSMRFAVQIMSEKPKLKYILLKNLLHTTVPNPDMSHEDWEIATKFEILHAVLILHTDFDIVH